MPMMKYTFDGLWTLELDNGRVLKGRGTSAQMANHLWFVLFNAEERQEDFSWKPFSQKMVFINPSRVVSAVEDSATAATTKAAPPQVVQPSVPVAGLPS